MNRDRSNQNQVALDEMTSPGSATTIVRDSADSIRKLLQSIDRMEEITMDIDDIADQVNLFALNAALKATRTDEEEKSPSLVTEEVRKLAASTSRATGALSKLVHGIQRQTTDVLDSMETGLRNIEG
ncbi:MAG: methyl-accepting chemotaxis protein [candidate division Zixibacteria bacterium]